MSAAFRVGTPGSILICALLFGPVASAATLRAFVHIRGATVYLSDLFANLEGGQDCELGDAPPPGSRLVIQKPQLEAISSQFGVDWTPLATDQTSILDRPGRTMASSSVISIIEAKIPERRGKGRSLLTLTGFESPMIDKDAQVDVVDLSIDAAGGAFHAALTVSVAGHETLRLPVEGRIDHLLSVPVPTRLLPAGEIVGPADLSIAEVPVSLIDDNVLEQVSDEIGLLTSRALPRGMPIRRSDLRRPDLVRRGGPVMMRLSLAGIEVEAQGQALDAGTLDDRVRVLNPVSRVLLLATVTGPNEVRLEPGSMPYVTKPSGFVSPGQYGRFDNPPTSIGGEP